LKYLLWIVIGYLAWRWFKASQNKKAEASTSSEATDNTVLSDAEAMVKCSQCGVYLPLSEALPGSDSQFFCSDLHRTSRNA
jgi:hypothetical protein